jgi:hypothetical protein
MEKVTPRVHPHLTPPAWSKRLASGVFLKGSTLAQFTVGFFKFPRGQDLPLPCFTTSKQAS